ncbi:MAG: hypothetical protein AB7U82_00655 [Blastocatellales bacterium]
MNRAGDFRLALPPAMNRRASEKESLSKVSWLLRCGPVRLGSFLAASLCALLAATSAYATDYGDISVRVESVTEPASADGYGEYRVMIINRSPSKPHRVMVEIYSSSYNNVVKVVRRTVESAPSSTSTVTMFMPQGNNIGTGAGVWIDGVDQHEATPIDQSRTSAWVRRSQNAFHLLTSRNVEKSGLMNDAAVTEGFKNPGGENDVAHLVYQSPMPEWSVNWLSYSVFDSVVITGEELREAPVAVQFALLRYVECGGSLLIIGAWDIPRQWQARRIPVIETATPDPEVKKLTLPMSEAAQGYFVGFGRLIAVDADGVRRITPAQWQDIKLGWKSSRPPEKTYYDIADINKDFPVVERIGVPVRGLFVMMLAFVVVIGPINLIWLARRRKKIWMLWTVPAIALVTCLAVTGFALFGEGVNATSRAEAFTILDETSHRATTIGWTAFYSPITPGEGLHFSYDTELIPVLPENWRYGGGDRTIDFSNDQHLDSGWVTARVPAYFKFRKSETRRERLIIRRLTDDTIRVVNGLGADIQKLWVADRSGKVYAVADVKAGAQADFSLFSSSKVNGGVSLHYLFSSDNWLTAMQSVEQNYHSYLMPGCYLAVLDASPFVEEGLKDGKTRKARTLVYGISAEAGQ